MVVILCCSGLYFFLLTLGSQTPEIGLTHQAAEMPYVPQPESIESDIKFYDDMSDRMRETLGYHTPIDIRTVQAIDHSNPKVQAPKRYIWMKAQELLSGDVSLNQVMLAYASDHRFLATCLQPHGISVRNKNLRMATIDHSMWFHHDFRLDEWLLYEVESNVASDGRGLVRGKFFTRDGKLVATTIQEGLIRRRAPKKV